MSSITTGARSTPSILGIENPQTSASTTAVERPCAARAMARLAVTDDLPTPPLPEAISSVRVALPGSANGMARPSAWPWAGAEPAVAAGLPCSFVRSSALSASLITVKSRVTAATPSSSSSASVTRRWISLRSGQPATVSAMRTSAWPPSMVEPLYMPRSTMLRCSSGSSTGRRASITSASVTATGVG